LLPRARGQAQKIIEDAQAYKAERTNRASGDADRFLSILREYQNAKDVTRKRLYLETMEQILPGIRKFVVDASVGKNVLQLLPLDEKGGK
jgi:membrane protease subunit HflK